jgi:hypothetical protein
MSLEKFGLKTLPFGEEFGDTDSKALFTNSVEFSYFVEDFEIILL